MHTDVSLCIRMYHDPIMPAPKLNTVTAYDVATACGVTQPTVSRILNGQAGKYREETCRRVQDTARKLGYRINAAARTTRTGRYGTFALLQSTSEAHSVLPPGLLGGIHAALEPRGIHLIVSPLPDAKLTADGFVPKILRELTADGLLINYSANIPDRLIKLIHLHHVPAVWINSQQPSNCVYPDDRGAAAQATERILSLGHRRLMYVDYSHSVANPAIHYSAIERYDGYRQSLDHAGLTPRRIGSVEALDEKLRVHRELVAMLTGPDRPTAVVCYGPREARSVAAAALAMRLDIPADLSIVMFADTGAYDEMGLHFATMIVPEVEVGHAAADLLSRRIASPHTEQPTVVLPFGFKSEQTLAMVPSC